MAKDAKAEVPKEKKEKKAPQELVTVKSGALSVDVGPAIIAGMDKNFRDEAKARTMMDQVQGKRYDLLSQTTAAIVKAGKADESIDLAAAFSGEKSAMNKLNDQLGIALGIKEVITSGDRKYIGYSKSVLKYFPSKNDDKDSDEYKRKTTLRSNFSHMLKKCAQAACTIIEQKMEMKMDKEAGTLMLSGPAVNKAFGKPEVLLNEKQTIKEGETSVTLKEKPSFVAIAALSAEAHGVPIERKSNDRTSKIITDPDLAIASLCTTLINAIGKLNGKVSDKQLKSLEGVQSAIAKAINE